MMTWPLSNTLRYSYPDHLLLDIAEHNGHYASDLNLMYTGMIVILKNRWK